MIKLAPEQLDLDRFERLVQEAGDAEPQEAAEKLREALALWRGPALADFAYEPFAQAAIGRLEEVHLLAVEMRVDADLALGRHAALVAELDALAAEHPLRERLRGQLMLALYRSGRQAEALAAYQTARRVLVDELGIEPSAALQELERAMLRQDPALELAQATAPERSILVAWLGDGPPEPLLAVAEPLARKEPREVIVARLRRRSRRARGRRGEPEGAHRGARGARSRRAVGRVHERLARADAARLATEQDVDLVLVDAPAGLLEDPDLGDLLRSAPCDVAVLTGGEPAPGPVLVPFAGTDHDWCAIELGAWLAGSWQVPLRLAGPAVEGGRDASRLLASASLAVQRALGVAAEPLLVEPGPEALVAAAADAGVPSSACPTAGARTASVRPAARWPPAVPDAARAQGPAAGRARAGGEPDPLHLVAQRLISAPTAAASASRRPASSCSAAGRSAEVAAERLLDVGTTQRPDRRPALASAAIRPR